MAAGKPNRRTPARRPTIKGTYPASNTGPALAGLFLLALIPAALFRQVPPLALGAYYLLSPITFFAYGLDKQSAREGRWRTRENTLHFLSLLGGWPGALVAQGWLRHKTKKEKFRADFLLTVVVNLGLLATTNQNVRNAFVARLLS